MFFGEVFKSVALETLNISLPLEHLWDNVDQDHYNTKCKTLKANSRKLYKRQKSVKESEANFDLSSK